MYVDWFLTTRSIFMKSTVLRAAIILQIPIKLLLCKSMKSEISWIWVKLRFLKFQNIIVKVYLEFSIWKCFVSATFVTRRPTPHDFKSCKNFWKLSVLLIWFMKLALYYNPGFIHLGEFSRKTENLSQNFMSLREIIYMSLKFSAHTNLKVVLYFVIETWHSTLIKALILLFCASKYSWRFPGIF